MKVINPSESKCIIKMQILRALYKSKRIISNYLSYKIVINIASGAKRSEIQRMVAWVSKY